MGGNGWYTRWLQLGDGTPRAKHGPGGGKNVTRAVAYTRPGDSASGRCAVIRRCGRGSFVLQMCGENFTFGPPFFKKS